MLDVLNRLQLLVYLSGNQSDWQSPRAAVELELGVRVQPEDSFRKARVKIGDRDRQVTYGKHSVPPSDTLAESVQFRNPVANLLNIVTDSLSPTRLPVPVSDSGSQCRA